MPRHLEPIALGGEALERETRLTAVVVEEAALGGVHADSLELDEAHILEGDLSAARIARLGLRDTRLQRVNLANLTAPAASLLRTVFVDSRLTGCAWPEAVLRDVTLRNCRMDLVSFRFARLERVTFEDCVLREADFQGAQLDSVSFRDCDLTGATLEDCRFHCSDLRRCRLDDLRGIEGLRGAAMDWADIVGLAGQMAASLGIRVAADGDRDAPSS